MIFRIIKSKFHGSSFLVVQEVYRIFYIFLFFELLNYVLLSNICSAVACIFSVNNMSAEFCSYSAVQFGGNVLFIFFVKNSMLSHAL